MNAEHKCGTTIRIYGLPIESLPDGDPSLLPKQDGTDPFLCILYCGYGVGTNERRGGTNRLWRFRRSSVLQQGIVDGYRVQDVEVSFYELELTAQVFEMSYRRVTLSAEISGPGIFASAVSVPPRRDVNATLATSMSRSELQTMVDQRIDAFLAGNPLDADPFGDDPSNPGTGYGGGCNSWRQSYMETRYGVLSQRDEWGADCD